MFFNLIVALNIISAATCIFSIIFFNRKLKIKSQKEIIVLFVIMLLWTIVTLWDMFTKDIDQKLLVTYIGYVAYGMLPSWWFGFVVSFVIRKESNYKKLAVCLYAISVCFIVLNWVNPNNLFYSGKNFIDEGSYLIFQPEHGPLYFAYMVFAYVVIIGTLVWMVVQSSRKKLKVKYLFMLAGSILVPVIFNLIYTFDAFPFECTSAGFFASCIILLLLYKNEFFSKLPLSYVSIINNMNMGYVLVAPDMQLVEINSAARKMLYLNENTERVQIEQLLTKEWLLTPTIMETGAFLRSLHSPDGTLRFYRATTNKLMAKDGEFFYAMFLQDETDLHSVRRRMLFLERRDESTGLYNRSYFLELLDKEIARRSDGDNHAIVLICTQIMNYRNSCRLFGDEMGNLIAGRLGDVYNNAVRSRDAVCRFASDEIYVFLRFEKTDNLFERIEDIIKGILSEFDKPITIANKSIDVKLNVGVAFAPLHAKTSADLISAANIALSSVSKFAKRPYAIYRENSGKSFNRLLKLENDMPKAIEENQFYLLYQPQVDLRTGIVVGVEALIRWNHPELGCIMPNDFISIAESSGLINPLGLWVIRQALSQQKQWQDMGIKVKVSVNVSINQLGNPEFANEVIEAVKSSQVDPSYFEVEFTESIALFPEALAHGHLEKLREHNIRIAMDDFGMGHSSLAFIKDFEPNTIKIDRALSVDILTNRASVAMIRSLSTLCASLGVDTVVEFIEHKEQLEILKRLQCFVVQGYLFSRPLTSSDCTKYIQNAQSNHQKSDS